MEGEGPPGQPRTAARRRGALSAAVRGLLLAAAVRSSEGLIAAGRNGGDFSMLSIGRRGGAIALRWSRVPGGERHKHSTTHKKLAAV